MTVYNGEKYLQNQIDSFLKQTKLPDEIIIADDCSNDKTLEILKNYENNNKIDIKIYRNETNLGFTKNFENAISKSTGDLIFLSDQDDIWYKEKIETIIKKYKENPSVLLIIHDADLVNQNLEKSKVSAISQVNSGFSNTDVFITGALTSFKKNLTKYFMPFPKDLLGHDGYIHFVARNLGVRMVIKDKLQMIRRHNTNTSGWVASSLKKINKLDVLKQQFNSDRADNYDDRLNQVEKVIEVISKIKNEDYFFSYHILEKSIKNLNLEKKAIKKRNEFKNKNFIEKKLIAFELLFKNQYKYFNGIWSFFRDIIR